MFHSPRQQKKITLLAPTGAQALGSFLTCYTEQEALLSCLLQTKSEALTPKKKKNPQTKLPPHTTSYRQHYSAAKRRTQTVYRNTQQLQSINGSITQIADSKASRLYYHRPSFLCLKIGFAWGKGAARDETIACGFLNWKCGWAIIKGIHSVFFSTKQSSQLERLLKDIIWKRFDQYLDSNQTPTKRNPWL
jgi:hypothetical protein